MSGHEGVAIVAAVDVLKTAGSGCKDGQVGIAVPDCCVALALGNHGLLAVGFLEGNGIFCFSLVQAFLHVILAGAEHSRGRNNIHVCPLHMTPQ
jgi:hypothetical protein